MRRPATLQALAQVFSCEFCKSFKNIVFIEHLWATAFGEHVSFNPFHATGLFLYPFKTSETLKTLFEALQSCLQKFVIFGLETKGLTLS